MDKEKLFRQPLKNNALAKNPAAQFACPFDDNPNDELLFSKTNLLFSLDLVQGKHGWEKESQGEKRPIVGLWTLLSFNLLVHEFIVRTVNYKCISSALLRAVR